MRRVFVFSYGRFCRGAGLLLTALVLLLASILALRGQTDADHVWVEDNYEQVINELLPIRSPRGFYVGYRSFRYAETLEYSFLMGYGPKAGGGPLEALTAYVRIADSVSVYDQMLKMRSNNPSEDATSIKAKLRLTTWFLTEQTCPSLESQLAKFQELRFGPPEFWSIAIHPLVHQFRIAAGMGDADLKLTSQDHPLVTWALDTRRALELCTKAVQPSQ